MGGDLVVDLRGVRIETMDDFWDAVAGPCGLPRWFGRNLDAWSDTIHAGGISEVIDSHERLIIHVDRLGLFAEDSAQVAALRSTFEGQLTQLVVHG